MKFLSLKLFTPTISTSSKSVYWITKQPSRTLRQKQQFLSFYDMIRLSTVVNVHSSLGRARTDFKPREALVILLEDCTFTIICFCDRICLKVWWIVWGYDELWCTNLHESDQPNINSLMKTTGTNSVNEIKKWSEARFPLGSFQFDKETRILWKLPTGEEWV